MKKILCLMSVGLYLACSVGGVFADDVADVDALIKTSMNDVLTIAKRADMTDEQKRIKLWDIVLETFDFERITEFTLGQFAHDSQSNLGDYADRRFTKAQQDEFRVLFTRHMGNNYLDRLDFNNVDVAIDLKPVEMLDTKKGIKRARVPTIINAKTPIDYMILNAGQGWKIYDIKVEGRSLVSAFRAEYKNILINSKPAELLQMLRDKIAVHDAAKNKKS